MSRVGTPEVGGLNLWRLPGTEYCGSLTSNLKLYTYDPNTPLCKSGSVSINYG